LKEIRLLRLDVDVSDASVLSARQFQSRPNRSEARKFA
jgi:hypothetical protein